VGRNFSFVNKDSEEEADITRKTLLRPNIYCLAFVASLRKCNQNPPPIEEEETESNEQTGDAD
jgi:hypothetical protein